MTVTHENVMAKISKTRGMKQKVATGAVCVCVSVCVRVRVSA
jgi:hypothetical protein